jgi:hypothetical protein
VCKRPEDASLPHALDTAGTSEPLAEQLLGAKQCLQPGGLHQQQRPPYDMGFGPGQQLLGAGSSNMLVAAIPDDPLMVTAMGTCSPERANSVHKSALAGRTVFSRQLDMPP